MSSKGPSRKSTLRPPEVGIFGLGYVGLTTAACLLEQKIRVEGYEISKAKRMLLARGKCPVNEPGVKPAIVKGLKTGLFCTAKFLTSDKMPEILFICVGTPSAADGSTDLSHVDDVFRQLARFAQRHPDFKSEVILRSTVPPGTLERLRKLHSGLFDRVSVAFYPEFLREGSAMKDFYEPPQSIVGFLPSSLRPVKLPGLLARLGWSETVTLVEAVSAESLKFACNAYHAVKICFANEVARLTTACGGNAVEVMDLFCRDSKLNISRKYLLPGNPYGGSCLTKDTKSMIHLGDRLGIKLDLIKNCATSNTSHFDYIVKKITGYKPRVVTMLGLSFKKHTNDVRNSPTVELYRRLTAKGIRLIQVHDFLVHPEEAVDINKRLQDQLVTNPTFVLHQNLKRALTNADLVLIMHGDDRYVQAVAGLRVPVLDIASWKGFS
jgi:GDP-mannose 6-dehydrogenase